MIDVPVVHPMVVHFPIALLLLTPALLVAWSHVQNLSWHNAAMMSASASAISTTAAYLTGEAMLAYSGESPMVKLLIERHETLALATLVGAWLVVGALTAVYRVADYHPDHHAKSPVPYWMRSSIIVLSAITAALAAYTGHVGGQMVWGELIQP